MLSSYEINIDTLVLIPVEKNKTKVIEQDEEKIIEMNITDIIDRSCKYYGSSLIGRKEGSKYLLDLTHKLPIIIDERQDIIFFPTMSPRRCECVWISLNSIKNFKKSGKDIEIVFENMLKMILPVSYSSFENQYYRANRLFAIMKRK